MKEKASPTTGDASEFIPSVVRLGLASLEAQKRKINKQDIEGTKIMFHRGLKSPHPGHLPDEDNGKCDIVKCCA